MTKKCSTCENSFIPSDKTLVCKTCSRCYCSNGSCWFDADDRYLKWCKDIPGCTIDNESGEITIPICDNCYYGDNA